MMTEQQLARALLQAGLLSAAQIQAAVQQSRTSGVAFAQVLVQNGLVSSMDILQVDADAFTPPPAAPPPPPAAVLPAPPPPAPPKPAGSVSALASRQMGLGLTSGRAMRDNNVVIEGEENRIDDPVMGTIVTYCNELLKIAVGMGASDMHLEPRPGGLLPRYRVDGHLRPGGMIPGELQPPILSRFKVLANLDITENRLPQDGRFRATVGGHVFDFRVSSLPSMHGEKIVLRLLDRSSLVTDLVRLGFAPDDEAKFRAMLGRANGMVLVTGPTGSGKTTTLYAALAAVRDETRNVITVEDPIEYELTGITQTKVHPEIGLTFATQLRAILRQDPDVIFVGEIRDNETADIAVRAALTGHLLLSTLHTNSAVATVSRLQDMGVPNYLLASSITGVLAQRLVRMICQQCKQQIPLDDPQYLVDVARLKLPHGTPLFYGAGCDNCNGLGTRGRTAILELLNIDSDLRRAITLQQDADALRRIAVKNGMRTLWRDALEKLQHGLTTTDEVFRALMGSEDLDDAVPLAAVPVS